MLGRGGPVGTDFTFYLEVDGAALATIPLTSSADNPYEYITDPLVWSGVNPSIDYVFRVRVVNNTTTCSSIWYEQTVTVWKEPETGPQYHIPNTFGE